MPLSPGCACTKDRTWRVERSLGLNASRRLGRSKLRTKTRGSLAKSFSTMSPRVGASAVAVKASV
jgi:hypothetical protein